VFFFDHFQSSICSIASVIWLNSIFCITEYDGIQPVLWGNKIKNQQILCKRPAFEVNKGHFVKIEVDHVMNLLEIIDGILSKELSFVPAKI